LRFASLRLVHFSGDIMPVKYLRTLKKCMPAAEFYNIYGQTEANSSLYFKVPETIEDNAWKIPIGRPFPNFDVFALDDSGKVVSTPNEEGELLVLSSTVALGYWNDGKKTQERFTPDPRNPSAHARVYKTGDLVRLNGDGDFVFTGRKDHMVKCKGFRVELDEIEIVLNSHQRIRQAAVVAVPDDLAGNKIIAYISLTDGSAVDSRELLELCSMSLPKYMMPELILYRQMLPTTSNDKVNRKALVQEFISQQHKHST
jgi:acyl-coenzyme A synthetase/AMP-(fatty) acid ligase